MKIISLDPRVSRMEMAEGQTPDQVIGEMEHWQTYEVFVQNKRGEQHVHAGIVHAPNGELALVLAKEQYARRGYCTNLWVIKTADVYTTEYRDSDIFDSVPEKTHREAIDYRVKEKINRYIQSKKQNS